MSRRNVFIVVCAAFVLFPLAAEGQLVSIKRLGDSDQCQEPNTEISRGGVKFSSGVLPNGNVVIIVGEDGRSSRLQIYNISADGRKLSRPTSDRRYPVRSDHATGLLLRNGRLLTIGENMFRLPLSPTKLHLATFNITEYSPQWGYCQFLAETDAGTVDRIAAVALPNGKVVTPVRTGGHLTLIAWKILENGGIERLGTTQAGTVDLISAVVLPNGNVVTPVNTGGHLTLIAWKVSDDGKQIQRLGTTQAGTVDLISAVALPNGNVVTAVRTGGRLTLIAWKISQDGQRIERLGTTQAGTVDLISATVMRNGNVVTAVRTGGRLTLIAWQILERGGQVERLGDSGDQAGTVREIHALALPNGNVATMVSERAELTDRMDDSRAPFPGPMYTPYRLIVWSIQPKVSVR